MVKVQIPGSTTFTLRPASQGGITLAPKPTQGTVVTAGASSQTLTAIKLPTASTATPGQTVVRGKGFHYLNQSFSMFLFSLVFIKDV